MADPGEERDAKLDARREQRVVASVGRRGLPQPWHDPQPLEAEVPHAVAELSDPSIGRFRSTVVAQLPRSFSASSEREPGSAV